MVTITSAAPFHPDEIKKLFKFKSVWLDEMANLNGPPENPYPLADAEANVEMIGMIKNILIV